MLKLRKPVSFLLAVFLLAALLPNAVLADGDGNPDLNTYTVTLRYDDNVQLRYQHKDGARYDEVLGDVPLGGASLGSATGNIPQLYCVDALIPFHSMVGRGDIAGDTTYPGGRTTDTVHNYVAVSPDNLPPILHGHWNELSWLVTRGYSGEYNSHDNASLTALRTRYPNLSDDLGVLDADITWDVAVMATKAAVWHYTNPDVAFLSTSFLAKSSGPYSLNGIKHRQFAALMKALIEDADKYAANPLDDPAYGVPFEFEIDGSRLVSDITDANGYYRGPYYFKTTGNADAERVFLEISGDFGGGIGFYYAKADGGLGDVIPGDLQRYGKDPRTDLGPGVEINGSFYIHVPSNLNLEGKSITALTRVTGNDVEMPIVLVHQKSDGSQDWNAIQAFIGLTTGKATAYASASLQLEDEPRGTITVRKVSNNAGNDPFRFRLTDDRGNPINLGNTTIDPNLRVNGSGVDGIFQITPAQTATIGQLPIGYYIVTELQSEGHEDDIVLHTINGADSPPSRTQWIPLLATIMPINIVFTNSPYVPPEILLSLQKLSSEDGKTFEGTAKFILTGPNSYDSKEVPTDANGYLSFSAPLLVPARGANVYTLTETAAPSNHFALMAPISIQVNADGDVNISADNSFDTGYIKLDVEKDDSGTATAAEITVSNEYFSPPPTPQEPDTPPPPDPPPHEHYVFIAKRSTYGSDPLPPLRGAEFTLEKIIDASKSVTELIYKGETDSEGMLFFNLHGLVESGDFDGEYILTEVSAPTNYTKLTGSITFEAGIDKFISASVDVPNEDDKASVTWLDIDDGAHEYFAFRIVDTYIPPSTYEDYPPPPPPKKPDPPKPPELVPPAPPVPEIPVIPPVPDLPAPPAPVTPDNPDLRDRPDSDVPTGAHDAPQTGDDTTAAKWLLLLSLSVCGAASMWRLREYVELDLERQ